MNRRNFFAALGATTVAASLPLSLQAAECSEELPTDADISSNHGHAIDLTIKQVLQLLRETNDSCPVEIDIQGNSGHPHAIQLSHQNLLDLIIKGEIREKATVVAGHSHDVNISLVIA